MTHARRSSGLFSACCALAICGWALAAESAAQTGRQALTIREVKDPAGTIIAIEAGPLPASSLAARSSAEAGRQADSDEVLSRILSVAVDDVAAGQTAMVGSYSVGPHTLRFTPRFPFRAGQAYRVVLRWPRRAASPASSGSSADEVTHRFHAPVEGSLPPAEVTAIFASAAVIPENQLRFYIHFSTPMSRGVAYHHVQLLDSRGRSIDLPFLELGEELWDPQQQRLTLLIDPGRIKRGVLPRENLGPVLRAGEQFTLVVKESWLDARNRPLRAEFTKSYRIGPPIERAIEPAQWQIHVPAAGSLELLAIDFPRPLDHALLERMMSARLISRGQIEGTRRISREERRWELRPAHPWQPGKYEIVVDSALEDLAGNRIGRPFEVDQTGPITQQIQAGVFRLEFEIPANR